MKCTYCSGDHPDGAKFCPVTGKVIPQEKQEVEKPPETLLCPNCNKQVQKNWSHCPNCSFNLSDKQLQNVKNKKKTKKGSTNIVWVILILPGIISIIGGTIILLNNFDGINSLILKRNESLELINQSSQIDEKDSLSESLGLSNNKEDPIEGQYEITMEFSPEITETQSILPPKPTKLETIPITKTISSTFTPTIRLTNTQTPTPKFGEEWIACPGLYPSRLRVDYTAKVSEDPPLSNRVRSNAGSSYSILGYIEPGERVTILDGPICVNDWIWWKIRSNETGLTGWTVEGDGEDYWLVPVK